MDIQSLIESLHKAALDWAENQPAFKGDVVVTDPEMMAKMEQATEAGLKDGSVIELKPARTDGKRAIRTKSTGDRVYVVDDNAKTKAWVTSPEILEKLGFTMADVQDVEDSSLLGYTMQPSIYKVD